MTLPTSGAITLSNVLTELKIANSSRAAPISLGDADVLALAGKSAPPISLSDLYGKSSYVAMSGTLPDVDITGTANPPSNYNEQPTLTLDLHGGKAPFTYTWSHVSGVGTVDANNAASTTAYMPVARFSTAGTVTTQVVQCSVLDAKGNTFVKQCTVTMTLA